MQACCAFSLGYAETHQLLGYVFRLCIDPRTENGHGWNAFGLTPHVRPHFPKFRKEIILHCFGPIVRVLQIPCVCKRAFFFHHRHIVLFLVTSFTSMPYTTSPITGSRLRGITCFVRPSPLCHATAAGVKLCFPNIVVHQITPFTFFDFYFHTIS